MSKSEKKLTMPLKEKEAISQIHKPTSHTGKTPKQIMSKHIRDKNDVITDEDFKNLNISIEIPNDTSHQLLEFPNGHERPKDEDKDPSIETPWKIISE